MPSSGTTSRTTWFGTNLYAESHDIRRTQEMLGHESPTTTAIYTKFDQAAGVAVRALTFKRPAPDPEAA
jgi:site-specific recombinase XerC